MRKTAFVVTAMVVILSGCASIRIPNYIDDKHPYKKIFYASFEDTLLASRKALEESGWKVKEVTDPALYEHNRAGAAEKQGLIFTETQHVSRILYTRYYTLNVYLTGQKDSTEMDVRYLVQTSFLLKTWEGYKNDRLVNQFFNRISFHLENPKK